MTSGAAPLDDRGDGPRHPEDLEGYDADDRWDAAWADPEDPDATGGREDPDVVEAGSPEAGWPPLPTPGLDAPAALELLRDGRLELVGRLVASSNNAMVGTVSVTHPDRGEILAPCVYKPVAGERPLWDFPDGTLARREVAAHVLSEAGGWGIVPPTVLRDGPFGPGMVQLWIRPDDAIDAVALVVEGDERLRPIAIFDAVANNADRKIGHLLPMPDGHVLGVDHGICFHVESKLRTVLWQWRGTPLTDAELATLHRLRAELDGPLGEELLSLLSPAEVRALGRRLRRLAADGCFPQPDPDRPAIPWPPY
ncbi:MAG TPA: SCO1664 family protein [Candidatus Dormibacteraeota bacterium]|nr:SCO1664 family protein [Candidatus Dormibacteraeota bacterium]